MPKRLTTNIITVLASVIFAAILSECILRVLGFEPWRYKDTDSKEPTMHAPDPVLGWRNKPGSYVVPPYDSSGKPVYITFEEDGCRRTGVHSIHAEGEIVAVGGSFFQGWAISDEETFAWKLQKKIPFLKVVNCGTGGYGSYQSLLMLEQVLPRMESPKIVLYGFIDTHEPRNAAPQSWLRVLSLYSRRGHVEAPFATMDDKHGLVRYPPEGYLKLPFRESSAAIALIEQNYMKMKTKKRFAQRRIVTEEIIKQMDKVCRQYHSAFYVVLLKFEDENKRHYMDFLNRNNIRFIDCTFPLTEEATVPGEGHPNGFMNTLWTQRISSELASQLKGTSKNISSFEQSRLQRN